MQKVNETFWLHYSKSTNQGNDCQVPCQSLMVTIGGRNTIKYEAEKSRNYSEVYIYYPPRVMLSQETDLYSKLTLLAEIGRYLGLTIGASMLQVALIASDAYEKYVKNKNNN